MEPLDCPETSVTTNLHYVTARENEDSRLHSGSRLKYVTLKLSLVRKPTADVIQIFCGSVRRPCTFLSGIFVSGLPVILLHQEGMSGWLETTGKIRQVEVTENSPFILVEMSRVTNVSNSVGQPISFLSHDPPHPSSSRQPTCNNGC